MSKATELYGITSLSQLKHFALNCGVKLELIERFGKTGDDIPTKLRGIRSIYAVHTKSFDLLSEDGSTSSLGIERASLVSFDGPMMTVHKAGIRPMNDKEKAKMAAWQEIENTPEFQERSRVDLLTDGSRTYWLPIRCKVRAEKSILRRRVLIPLQRRKSRQVHGLPQRRCPHDSG